MPSKPKPIDLDNVSTNIVDDELVVAVEDPVDEPATVPAVWGEQPVNRHAPEHMIKAVQTALGLAETGVFDSETKNAVRQFQVNRNLPNTGTVDKATWDLLM